MKIKPSHKNRPGASPLKNLSWASIKEKASQLVWRHVEEKGWKNPADIKLDMQELYETVIYPEFEFQLITNLDLGYHQDEKVLGKTLSKDRVILIDRSIVPPSFDPRYAFTFGHECGHAILHKGSKPYYCTEKCIYRPKVSDKNALLEAQANFFSEHFLMPDELIKYKFSDCYQPTSPIRYYGSGEYCFNPFGGSLKLTIRSYYEYCRALAKPLCSLSSVSNESMALKIHKLGLIRNYTSEEFGEITYHISSILKQMAA